MREVRTIDEAWLLGLIAGDGHVGDYGVSVALGGEVDMPMAREAERVAVASGWPVSTVRVALVLMPEPRKPCLTVFLNGGRALTDHLRALGDFGVYRWRVPGSVLRGSLAMQGAWVAGFTDADGHVRYNLARSQRAVVIDSVNKDGLDQVSVMLANLGVKHRRTEHDRRLERNQVAHKIHVCERSSLERFTQLVPLRCPRKAKALTAALASYERDILTKAEVDALLPAIQQRLASKEAYTDIANALGITSDNVRNIVRTRNLEGHGRGHGKRHLELNDVADMAASRVADGERTEDVAADLGMTRDALAQALRNRGKGPGKSGSPAALARARELDALIPQARALVERGLTNADIATELGHDLTATRVAALLCKHGITRRKPD